MLEEIRKSLLETASSIKNYDNLPNQKLIDTYIDTKDITFKQAYYSALVLNNWITIYKLKSSVSNIKEFTIEDCYDWVIDGIEECIKYQSWRDRNSTLYNDPNAFDKMFNLKVSQIRILKLKEFFRERNKANLCCDSLDKMKEDIKFEPATRDYDMHDTYAIISYYINNYEYLKAVLIDKICFGDVWTINKNGNIHFSQNKLVNELVNINEKYFHYFKKKYSNVNIEALKELRHTLNKYPRRTLPMFIKKRQDSMKYELKQVLTKENT